MSQDQPELAGRGALITGAGRGLGRAIAERFTRAGADVLLAARSEADLEEVRRSLHASAGAGRKILVRAADVSNPADCDALIETARRELPDFSILVNNAAIHGAKGPLEETDWNLWVDTIRINLLGPVRLCRAAIPIFKVRKSGKIINLSGGGATAPMPRVSAYAASKAALVRFTETLAHELRDVHIDVNAIAPGAMNTRMLDEVLAAGPERVGRELYERSVKQRDEGGTPPEKAAELAVFLASSRSDGITGRLISAVWDDWRSFPEHREKIAASDLYTLRRITPENRAK